MLPGVPLLVTENGIATADDEDRIRFTDDALRGLSHAIAGGADVRGYVHWQRAVSRGACQGGRVHLLLVWTAPREVVERFAEAEPYVTNGLVTRWSVREWNVVIG